MKKINIAELLKDCPKGMELYSPMYGVGKLTEITNRIHVKFPKQHNVKCFRLDGKVSEEGEIMLFPKGKTTWEGFQRPFKDGDIVATNGGFWIGITVGGVPYKFVPTYCVIKSDDQFEAYFEKKEKWSFDRLATEEEKEKLFKAIKDNGYKWNAETKTLEKLVEPKFKVGDRIQGYGTHINYPIRVVKSLEWDRYRLDNGSYIKFGDEHAYKLLKFDIANLKPFDKVLVRNTNKEYWMISMFGYISNYDKQYFMCIANSGFYQSIPYEHNEHLCGTTNDCDEFYKTWV